MEAGMVSLGPDTPRSPVRVAAARTAPVDLAACGLARAVDLIGDRWTLLILREAFYGITRFEDFLRDLGCPRSILSGRLKALEANGLMVREAYRETGQRTRHAYRLTDTARPLMLPLLALMQWMDSHVRTDRAPVRVTAADGRNLQAALIDESGVQVPLDQMRLTVIAAGA
jgi:DNA-binding HxlR family transcriptional regulator